MHLNTRQLGLVKLLIGGVVYAAIFAYVFDRGDFVSPHGGVYTLAGMGAPGALALVGLIELVFGISFKSLSSKWDSLTNMQRVLLGSSIIVLATVLIFGSLLLVAWTNAR